MQSSEFDSLANRLFRLGSQILCALNQTAFMVFGVRDENQKGQYRSGWLNVDLAKSSKATKESMSPMNAFWKLGELLAEQPEVRAAPRSTPIFSSGKEPEKRRTGWMGAVQMEQFLVALSKMAQEHDRLLAAILVYACFDPKLRFVEITTLVHEGSHIPTLKLSVTKGNHFLAYMSVVLGAEPVDFPKDGLIARRGFFIKTVDPRGPACLGLTAVS